MPSQEEYLDNLLKDVINGEQISKNDTSDGIHTNFFNGLPAEYDNSTVSENGTVSNDRNSAQNDADTGNADVAHLTEGGTAERSDYRERYDIQDTADLSPEEIERILTESAGAAPADGRPARESVDLETLLQEAEEADLKDINDMLQKADRNEPVDEGIIALLEQAQQQNAEIEWGDDEEQRHVSRPKKEKGLRKFFSRLRFGKKPAKSPKPEPGEERLESREQDSKNSSADSEMEELFGAMEEVGSGQAPQGAEETEHENAPEKSKGSAEGSVTQEDIDNIFTESAWPELQGLSLGKGPVSSSEKSGVSEAEANAELRNQDVGLEENAELNDLLENLGVADALSDLDSVEGQEDENLQEESESADVLDILGGPDLSAEEEESVSETEKASQKAGKKSKPEKTNTGRKGLFARLLDFLTQEDPEVEEEQQLILSDENDAILKELNEENAKKKGRKKKAKKKKGAERENGQADFDDEEEKTDVKKAKGKKPKAKKVREKNPEEPEKPGKRLSLKRVSLIFLICATVGAVILILGSAGTDFADKKKAAAAFYEGDYETCYQNLIGKRLNESQQVMYNKSESILKIRLWMREYEMFVQAGQEPEALDSLLQSVHDYPALYQFSSQWNAAEEVRDVYDQMLEILQSKYGLTEEMAETIANEWDDLGYSKMVRSIAGGGTYDEGAENSEGQGAPVQEDTEELEDLLPEEEELGNEVFADEIPGE